jgi:hypothetical protein
VSIDLLNAAVMDRVLRAIPVALGIGDTDMTVGGELTTGLRLPAPKMGDCPPPPHAVTKMLRIIAMNHDNPLELPAIVFICLPL